MVQGVVPVMANYLMKLREAVQWNKGRSVFWQALLVLVVLLYVAGLHWSNDGLWFQGDSPRHAANGLFWWDFLASFPVNPIKFALSYYARYPVIHPTAHPPLFYLIEGAAFRVLGVSPFVSKGLVLTFLLLAGFYLTAWLRRWISKEAGWGGALIVLQPLIIRWGNVVMLNVPSMALGFAALYHARRWIEAPVSRHLYPTVLFALAAILTYVPSGIVVMVILAWIIMERQWKVLWDRRVLMLGLLSALLLLPWALVAVKWAPTHFSSVLPNPQLVESLSIWTYYLKQMPRLFTTPLLVLAILGVVIGLHSRGQKQEVKLALIWVIVCYFGFSYLRFRAPRYILLLNPPFILLSIVSLVSLLHLGSPYLGRYASYFFLTGMAAFLGFHIWAAPLVQVFRVEGFQEVVAFLESVAPHERVFYDGNFDGIFSFYVRARDKDYGRGVVLGSKLLYASSLFPRLNLIERISSPAEVVEVLRKEGGCRWVAIERWGVSDRVPAARLLRQASAGPEFELVKSFRIMAHRMTWVDVYRFLPSVEKSDELNLRFPGLGKGVLFRVKPIEKNSKESKK
jgi:4-amino-4-deoxy-L-arabinose transferase-like glycosyltransferase